MKDIGDNTTFAILGIAVILLIMVGIMTDKIGNDDKEKHALREYYDATERLLDSLNVNENDSIFSTRAGYDYLRAHEGMEKYNNR